MQSKHFFGHRTRIVEIAASSDAPGEIGEAHAVIAMGVFVDQTDILPHVSYLNFKPACFLILRSVPSGMSRLGYGTVTRAGFGGCLN